MSTSRTGASLLALSFALAAGAHAQGTLNKYGYPLKHKPLPTSAAITREDLMTRLYIYADDSMRGRQVGFIGNYKATNYIAAQLKLLGVEPGGDNGTYFQTLPYVQRKFTDKTTLTAGSVALHMGADFEPIPARSAPKALAGAPVIYGGDPANGGTLISPEQAAGKFVILASAPAAQAAAQGGRGGRGAAPSSTGNAAAMFPTAAGVAVADLDAVALAWRGGLNDPQATATAYPPANVAIGDVIVTTGNDVAVIRNGALIGGKLPAGRTAASIQQSADSATHAAAALTLRTAARRADSTARAAGHPLCGPSQSCISFTDDRGNVIATIDSATLATLTAGRGGRGAGNRGGGVPATTDAPLPQFRLTKAAAARLLGKPLAGLSAGATGAAVSATLDYQEAPSAYARNVIGIIRGSDPALRGEYVAIGAHNDHIGMHAPVDHDSLKAYNDLHLRLAIKNDLKSLTAAQTASIKVDMDSIRKLFPKPRIDSVDNGADDDGSGSMGVLEIAEYIAKMPVKPKRSIIFVWHTGEEAGLVGSTYFTTHMTVPADSIVTQINIDMIGRGRAEDVIGGGDQYLGAVGSKNLSHDLNSEVIAINSKQPHPFQIDYRFDDPTLGVAKTPDGLTPWNGYNNIYGRSDHFNYAKKCIPIVFFFTALHGDYHQPTDEAEYIDYPHYAAIDNYIRDLLVDVANRSTRPQLDAVCTRQ